MKKLLILTLIFLTSCTINDSFRGNNENNHRIVYTPQGVITNNSAIKCITKVHYTDRVETLSSNYSSVQGNMHVNIDKKAIKFESEFYFQDGTDVKVQLLNYEGHIVEELVVTQQPYTYSYTF